LVINLGHILNELRINPYQFAKMTKIRHSTIYDMIHNESRSLKVANIEIILATLNNLSREKGLEKHFTVNDLFSYKEY